MEKSFISKPVIILPAGILKHQTGNFKHQMKGAATTFRNEHDPFDFMRFLYGRFMLSMLFLNIIVG